MFYQRTWLSADVHLNRINSTVTHIRNREVDHTISSKKRDRSGSDDKPAIGFPCILLPAKFTIPNALLILFFPLYTFCNQFDIFTVCTADNRILSDLYVVRDKGACYDCTFFYFHTRHQYTVNNLCSRCYFCSCKQDRVLNQTIHDTSLCDKCSLYTRLRTDILWQRIGILGIDLPGTVGKIQCIVLIQQIHIGFP